MVSADLLPSVHRLDADTYERMVASGAFDGQRIELIDGLLIEMSPASPLHDALIERLAEHLGAAVGHRLRIQMGLRVTEGAIPEPDLALVAGPLRFDLRPRTAALVVEVAVSSLALDRARKAELYAVAGVGAYWIVDVAGRAVEVRSEPGPGGFARSQEYGIGDVVPSPVPGVPDLAVADLFDGVPTVA